jgi:hypothetical protein
MTQLESSKTPFAPAYPLIIDGIEERERSAAEAQRRGMNEDNVIVVIENMLFK